MMGLQVRFDRTIQQETARCHGDEYRARLSLMGGFGERLERLRTSTRALRAAIIEGFIAALVEPILPRQGGGRDRMAAAARLRAQRHCRRCCWVVSA